MARKLFSGPLLMSLLCTLAAAMIMFASPR
jgi:hypothetical protein